MVRTIAIIGTGRVGTTTAYTLILQNLASHIILLDTDTKRCIGESIDLSDALAFSQCTHVTYGCYQDLINADIIIITAGKAQKDAQQSREDLAQDNKNIISSICNQFPKLKNHCCVIVVTNPVDLMTRVAQASLTNHPISQIFGSGTWLDTQRLRRIIGTTVAVAPESIQAFVIGEHGDRQIVNWHSTTIAGLPIDHWGITQEQQETIAQKARTTVYEIIEKKQATFFGIAACIADICSAIIFDEQRIIPLSWTPDISKPSISLPSIIGRLGIKKQIKTKLEVTEEERFAQSIKHLTISWQNVTKETNGQTPR